MQKEKEPRSQDAIFADLQELAKSPGAMHEISEIVYRDWVITVDRLEGRVVDEQERRWSTEKLNTNELMLLVGLMVQSSTNQTFEVEVGDSDFVQRADALLREFHDRVNEDARSVFDPETRRFLDTPNSLGTFAREAIYYGSQSFYLHQFSEFARHRYRADGTWLLQNAGISIRPVIEIAWFIVERLTDQMSGIGQMREEGQALSKGDLTSSLLISKAELRKRFGTKADAFIAKFATPATNANAGFDGPFAINAAAIAPLIAFGEYLYVPNQYRLLESVYESPFYWMIRDDGYKAAASDHRGAFLEETVAHILGKVFGAHNVFINARLPVAANKIGGEIDVLVRYGEFVIVVQAKSKRITLAARAGDPDALNTDFKGAIQDPYEQALASCDLLKEGASCHDRNGAPIDLPKVPRLFPVVVLSDLFPAATSLSRALLKRPDGALVPVIWDIAELDCVARLLPTPIEMVFYLKCRAEVFDSAISDSEYNYLGYHIRAKLALPPDVTMMMLDRDFATVVDDYMISADLKLDVPRPLGVLESLDIPLISPLLAALKSAPPEIAGIVIELYDFSEVALEAVSENIVDVREDVKRTNKAIKAFSIRTGSGGLTYAVVRQDSDEAKAAAAAIGRKHKYETRSDRWYVIVDDIRTNRPVDSLLPVVWPWVEDDGEAVAAERVGDMFRSRQVPIAMGRGSSAPGAEDE